MNTAELTAMNAETLNKSRIARTLANITRRAETLFEDGYRLNAENAAEGLYFVHSPKGDCYLVWSSVETGHKCNCPCFAEMTTCKHLEAVDMMTRAADEAAQEAAMEAEWERRTEWENYCNGRHDR